MPRRDVIDLIVGSVRTRTQQRNDMGAQLAALTIAERNLIALVDRYGVSTVEAAVERILDIGEQNMRAAISGDAGRCVRRQLARRGRRSLRRDDDRLRDRDRRRRDERRRPEPASGEELHQQLLGEHAQQRLLRRAHVRSSTAPPYNEGLYRPIHVDLGRRGR